MRSCRVSVTGLDGVTHSVDVQASSLFEAASAALTAFRGRKAGATEALTPNARFRVEVQYPPTETHAKDAALLALERKTGHRCGQDCSGWQQATKVEE